MNKCTGIMGWVFGHKFRPIITLSATHIPKNLSRWDFAYCSEWLEMADKYRDELFHGCACQRCGAVTGEKK